MTAFQLWQAGDGPEPPVIVVVRSPWEWTRIHPHGLLGYLAREQNLAESSAAEEECRAALAATLFGGWYYDVDAAPEGVRVEVALLFRNATVGTVRAHRFGEVWQIVAGPIIGPETTIYAWRPLGEPPLVPENGGRDGAL